MCSLDNIKKRLCNYHILYEELQQIKERLQELEISKETIQATSINDMPKRRNVNKDKIVEIILKIEDLEKEYNKKFDKVLCELHFIEGLIKKLEPRERMFMRKRYIENKKIAEICKEMNYTRGQIYRIHTDALNQIKKLCNKQR